MIPANVRLLESAAAELRRIRARDSAAFESVLSVLIELSRPNPRVAVRLIPVDLRAEGESVRGFLHAVDARSHRILFEGHPLLLTTAEGWNLVRRVPLRGRNYTATVWAIVPLRRDD